MEFVKNEDLLKERNVKQALLVGSLISASNKIYDKLNVITANYGITYHQYLALNYYKFKKTEPVFINELVSYMGDRYGVFLDGYRNVKRLYDLGLIEPKTPNNSGKFRGTIMTKKGAELLNKLSQQFNQFQIISNKIDSSEYEIMLDLLDRIASFR